ncbi:MAG TPA: hypothetical protein PKN36_08835 [bacterium]|nr:hypothetical protein [bacterium]
MRKIIMLIGVTILIFSSGCSKQNVVLPLDEAKTAEAVKFGIDNAALTNTEFISPWTLSSGGYVKGEGSATILTPFLRVAIMSKRCSMSGSKLEDRMIKSILSKEAGFINFEVTLYGDTYGFGRTVEFSLIHGESKYKPVAQFMPSYADMGRDYTCIAKGWAKFEKLNITDDADIKLSVSFKIDEEKDDVTVLDFNFDMKKFK